MRIIKFGSRNGSQCPRSSEVFRGETNASFEEVQEHAESFWEVVDRSKFSRSPTAAQVAARENFKEVYNTKQKKGKT